MDKYISKSDAVFAACRVLAKFGACTMGPFCPDSGCKEVREEFDNVPAADVVEVRHGEWKHIVYHNGCTPDEDMICSECGASGLPNWNYCPNCGADLRGYGMEESDAH